MEEEADNKEEYNIMTPTLREKERAMNMNGYFGYQPI